MPTNKKQVQVDVVSDIMCPWCWVGKRKLESAIRQSAGEYEVSVQWHPFLLRPDMPREGTLKAPATPDNPRVGMRLKQAGQSVGIDFTGKCDRAPNTLLAHCLMKYALDSKGAHVQNKLQEAIFRGYFTDGLYPDVGNLATLGAEVGLDHEEVRRVLASGKLEEVVMKEARGHARSGVSGVPFFFINGKPAFSGAQDVDSFVNAFEQLALESTDRGG
eukprot:CAMPEP_0181313166 /NCGR_PEP_ID=MMETSP1101-20121128/14103_1 /TAXON_ID=46948 /ORGANISM="Rhodomonas abbreviata, Strain Caron Lab Isolate" /LENGTH=216 /DNA_ID=CAMNT_0023420101 /DNA_START=233 /DNA_END=883 /DNA_ORIENTATION=+